jgi:outer membrane lipoprotein-sorting protein
MFTAADYDRGVSDVGDLLELLQGASGRWQTLQCTIRSWHDTELQGRAFERWQASIGSGSTQSIMFSTDGEEERPREYEFNQRVWIVKPDLLREEGEHGTSVSRGELWWHLSEHQGFMSNESDSEMGGPKAADAHPLHLAPAMLIPALRFETVERKGDTLAVTAKPSESRHVHFGHPAHGADEHRLTVDAERGVVLAIENFIGGKLFSSSHLRDVVFDEPIPDEVFVLEAPDGVEARSPRDLHPQVTLEEAAELAGFAVFAISELPEGNWRHSVHFHRPARAGDQSLHLSYHRADGRGWISVDQKPASNTTWVRSEGQQTVEVDRDDTRITISSETYDEDELQRLADNLVRV